MAIIDSSITVESRQLLAGVDNGMKLSAKFARQESEEARQARIARRRIRGDRAEAVRQMLGLEAGAEAARPPRRGIRKPKST